MNALFEAQADFVKIEQMISQKFGIPADARILCGLHAPTPEESKYSRGYAELADSYKIAADDIDAMTKGQYNLMTEARINEEFTKEHPNEPVDMSELQTAAMDYQMNQGVVDRVLDVLCTGLPELAEYIRLRASLYRHAAQLAHHHELQNIDAVMNLLGEDEAHFTGHVMDGYCRVNPAWRTTWIGAREEFKKYNAMSADLSDNQPAEEAFAGQMLYSPDMLDSWVATLPDEPWTFAVGDDQIEQYINDAPARGERIAEILSILRQTYMQIARQKAVLKAKATEFVKNPGPNDYVESAPLRNLPEDSTWDIIPLVNYIRVWAIQYMTYDDFFGIGNSSNAASVISKGAMAEFDAAATRAGKNIWDYLDKPSTLPAVFRDYIALQEKRFLSGIMRIAFNELGLMDYMVDHHKVLDEVFRKLGIDAGVPSDEIKLTHFGKIVIPKLTLMAILGQPSPTAIYSKSELEKGDKYFGAELAQAMKDTIENLDFVPDANLSRGKGGEPLSYDDLLEVVDTADASEEEYIKSATTDVTGNTFVADVGDEENAPAVVSSTQLTLTTDDPDECPAYRTGDWYVVYVRQETASNSPADYKSARGWFAFDGPGNIDGRFYLNPDYSKGRSNKFGVNRWCIVHSPDDYWSTYVNIDGNGYAYFLIHKDAYVSGAGTTAYGCTFDSIDAENGYHGVPNFAGMMRARNCFMDRDNTYAMNYALDAPGDNTKNIISTPKNMLPSTSDLNRSANMSIILLTILGKWDESITGEENIINRVKELTNQWIPVCGGKMVETKHGMPSTHSRDMTSIARILTGLSRSNNTDSFLSIVNGTSTIKYHGTEWVRRKFSETHDFNPEHMDLPVITSYLMFVPYEATREGEEITGETPALLFKRTLADGITAMSPRPVTVGACNDIVRSDQTGAASKPKKQPFRPDDTDISWFMTTNGASSKKHVGMGADGGLYICGPDTEDEPLKIADSWGTVPSASHMFTYISTPDGYNIVLTDKTYRQFRGGLSFVGYVRKGKVRWMCLDAIGSTGNAVMHEVNDNRDAVRNYYLGAIDGNIKPMNNNQATAYIYIAPRFGGFSDHIGLKRATIVKYGGEGHLGVFGLGIMNGQFGQHGNNQNVGIIRWYDEKTLEPVQGDTVVTVGDIDPAAMRSLPVICVH